MSAQEYIHENITLLIIGDHPHSGEKCHPIGENKDTITETGYGYLVKLIDCPHWVERSYVLRCNLKMIKWDSLSLNNHNRVHLVLPKGWVI